MGPRRIQAVSAERRARPRPPPQAEASLGPTRSPGPTGRLCREFSDWIGRGHEPLTVCEPVGSSLASCSERRAGREGRPAVERARFRVAGGAHQRSSCAAYAASRHQERQLKASVSSRRGARAHRPDLRGPNAPFRADIRRCLSCPDVGRDGVVVSAVGEHARRTTRLRADRSAPS
jgi:hypothetical protein